MSEPRAYQFVSKAVFALGIVLFFLTLVWVASVGLMAYEGAFGSFHGHFNYFATFTLLITLIGPLMVLPSAVLERRERRDGGRSHWRHWRWSSRSSASWRAMPAGVSMKRPCFCCGDLSRISNGRDFSRAAHFGRPAAAVADRRQILCRGRVVLVPLQRGVRRLAARHVDQEKGDRYRSPHPVTGVAPH